MVRLNHEKGASVGEFAVMVRSDLKHQGIGHELIILILRLAAERGITRVTGDVLWETGPCFGLSKSWAAGSRTMDRSRTSSAWCETPPSEGRVPTT